MMVFYIIYICFCFLTKRSALHKSICGLHSTYVLVEVMLICLTTNNVMLKFMLKKEISPESLARFSWYTDRCEMHDYIFVQYILTKESQ